MVERPVVSSQRREPAERELALSREPVRPEASLFGGSPPRRSSRGLFPSSPSLATRRTAPFPADPAAGARADERRRDRSSRVLSFVACRHPERRARGAPPRVARALARAGPIPAASAPTGGCRACPPADAGRRGLDVRDFPRFRRGGAVVFSVFTSPHPRAFSRLRANEPRSRRPSPHPSPSPLRPHVRVQRTTMASPTRPRRCPRISPRSSSTRATPRPARQPPVPSGPDLAATRSRPWPPSPPGRASARRWRTTSSPRRNSAGRTRPRPRGNSPTLARARITAPRRRATTIVAEAGGAFARTAAAVPPRRRTRTRTRPRYRPARWRVRVPRVLEERARVWRRRSRRWLTRRASRRRLATSRDAARRRVRHRRVRRVRSRDHATHRRDDSVVDAAAAAREISQTHARVSRHGTEEIRGGGAGDCPPSRGAVQGAVRGKTPRRVRAATTAHPRG